MINYFEIIDEVIGAPTSRTYKIYVVHATLVTNKALQIARRLNLGKESLTFIEEAGMLHDIGVVRVDSAKMDCVGDLPYIAHGVEGAKILRARGLEEHAKLAERHVGVGLTAAEIEERDLPLPRGIDYVPTSIEEQIVTYADLFFSKREATLWREDSFVEIEAELAGYGGDQVEIFREWGRKFGS